MKNMLLGKLTNIKTGKLDVNAGSEDGQYPFFTCATTPYKINNYAFDNEAVLIAGNGDLNVKYYKGKFNAYQRTYVIQNKDNEILFMKYLYYFMETYMDRLRRDAIGGIIKYIKLGHLTDAKIPLPPFDDQIRIAHVLGKVEGLIARRKHHLQQLDELLKSVFLEMFGDPVRNEKGWRTDSLSSFGGFKNGLNFRKGEAGVKVRYLGVGDFGVLSKISDTRSLSTIELNALPSENYFLRDGDIVLVRSNGNRQLVGRCIVIYPNDEKVTYSGFCIRYRIDSSGLNAIFIAHLFRIPSFRLTLLHGGQGANIQNINQKILSSLNIPIPAINIQNQFATIVEKVEGIKSQYQQSLTGLENLYGALSQKAFKGELALSRIPITAEDTESKEVKDIETGDEQGMAESVGLPAPADLAALKFPQGRKEEMERWLEIYLEQRTGEAFSADRFMQLAQQKMDELLEDEPPELGVADYDWIKERVFRLLENGQLTQTYNDAENRVQLTREGQKE